MLDFITNNAGLLFLRSHYWSLSFSLVPWRENSMLKAGYAGTEHQVLLLIQMVRVLLSRCSSTF
jgi:hypothetical protein